MADRGSASTDSGPGNGARDRPPCVLSIAGSDSGGGAGIQADLKAFAACGVHGMTAITALTAQNTVGVSAVEPVSPEMIVAQVAAVADDIGVDAVKIGMLGTVGTIEAVAAALDLLRAGTPVVLDPVMVSESGAELLEVSARGALMELLLPRVTVVTPNLPEARALMAAASARASPAPPGAAAPPGAPALAAAAAPDAEDVGALARALRELGPQVVVVTGGHREQAIDVFFDGAAIVELPGERYPSGAAHGSGCTHSSVLAARLAWGDSPLEAARVAKRMASEAVRDGLRGVGAGAGPVNILGVT
ncbi:MAG: bifunctional hydroxymethylpyrimidine kinase/phosphomethylpyrimidine kinase [Solirubrobacteraceae bacterium]